MKSTFFAAGLLFTAALSGAASFAGTTEVNNGTLTREAVRAEYFAAQKNGTLPSVYERGHDLASRSTNSTVTREAVRAEYFAAQKNGALPSVYERGYDLASLSTSSAVTREAVQAEYFAARQNGALPRINQGK